MSKLKAYAGVARAPFLLLPLTLVASGAAAAAHEGHFNLLHTLVALVGLVLLHIAVNVLNEASDLRTGIDLRTRRTPFSGGSGTLPSGALSHRAASRFGFICAGIGILMGAWFLWVVGWALLPFVLLGALFVLGYTTFLARIGIGEIAAGLGLSALPVAGTALVQEGTILAQDGSLFSAPLAASIPAFFMTFNLLLLNEFPDEEADRSGGRRNLVILFGRKAAAFIYAAAALLTPASVIVAVLLQVLPWPCLAAVLPSILLISPLSWAFTRAMDPVPLPALAANVGWNLATNAVLAAALVLNRWIDTFL